MTTRESAVLPPIGQVSAQAAPAALKRFGRWLLARGWIHALLLLGVVSCLYPVVWMVMTSVMTDEEIGQNEIAPRLPQFRGESPYVRDAVPVPRPEGVDGARFAGLLPSLRQVASGAIAAALPSRTRPPVDVEEWVASASSVLLGRALAQLPRQTWASSDETIAGRVRTLCTPDAAAAALGDRLSRLELSTVTLRSLDGHLYKLAAGGDPADWAIESGAATLSSLGDALRVDYGFRDGGDAPVVLVHDFELPAGVEPRDLHKLVVSMRSDASWHGIDATLDVGGTHWEGARTTYLAQNRAQSMSLQPPTFDDTTVRARTWVPLRAEGPSDRLRNARLRLVLSPSSRARAVLAKVQRNYLRAFDSVPFLRYVGNSLLIVVLTMAGATFSSAFVAYAFARLAWPGRGVALVLLLSTMMVPPQVTMIPSFLIWRAVGCYNTLNPLWVPAWLGNALFIFLMIQHMKTIPRELEEAARIDGLGVVQTWFYVILPQLKPSLAAIAVMSFLAAWNEFMGPLIYLRDQSKFPLSLGLFGMRIDQGADWSMLMAANVLMTLPPLIAFFRFQRHLVEGITVTGMKG